MLLNPYRFGLPPGPLQTGLISYWKLDEASGDAIDAHGSNNLTDNNTVGTAAGKIGTARDFEADNVEYLSIPSNASLQMGDIAFTFTAWVRFETLGTTRVIWSKSNNALIREYWLSYQSGINRIRAEVFPAPASAGTSVTISDFSPTLGVWYFIAFWHDPVADKIYIQRDNGLIDEVPFTSGVGVASAAFVIGAVDNATRLPMDGAIDEVGFWKRLLTPAERTALYNAGNGLAYPFT